ncbi:MAG: HAD family phosphatase [Eubacterium sp.]|nr:HAD family phosphatase [Eubacterium sp.]
MKAVVFDMDGVLFDTESVCMKAWDYAGEVMGVGKAGYMVLKTLGMNADKAIEIIRNEFGDDFDAVKFKQTGRDYSYNFFNTYGVPEKPGLYEILDYLKNKGYKIALASSTSSQSVHHHLQEKDIEKYFDAVICGDMVEKSKPEPDIYLKACKELNEKPSDCVAIEDSKNGLLSAHRAGMKVIMVPDLWQGEIETDSFLMAKCENLTEIMTVL